MGKPRQSCIAASRSATMDRCEGLRGVCADFTGLEPKFDSDLVGLTPDAFLRPPKTSNTRFGEKRLAMAHWVIEMPLD